MKKTLCVLTATGTLLSLATTTDAATRTWTGLGAGTSFDLADNWEDGVPTNGDSLIFVRGGETAHKTAALPNGSTRNYDTILFRASGAENEMFLWNLGGNTSFITLSGLLRDSSGNARLPDTLANGARFGILNITSRIQNGELTLSDVGIEVDAASHLEIYSAFKGTGTNKTLIKDGAGDLSLYGANRGIETVHVKAGTLAFSHVNAFVSGIHLDAGAFYAHVGGATSYVLTSLTGSGIVASKSPTHGQTLAIESDTDLTFDGSFQNQLPNAIPIGGDPSNERSLSVVFRGEGTFTLTGVHTHTGNTTVSEGRIVLNGTPETLASLNGSRAAASNGGTFEIGVNASVNNGVAASGGAGTGTVINRGTVTGFVNALDNHTLIFENHGTYTGAIDVSGGGVIRFLNHGVTAQSSTLTLRTKTVESVIVAGSQMFFDKGAFSLTGSTTTVSGKSTLSVSEGASLATKHLTINATEGHLAVSGGTLAVDGTLTFSGAVDTFSALDLTLENTVQVTATNLTLANNAKVRLGLSMTGSAEIEDTFTLISYTTRGAGTGQFVSVNGINLDETREFELSYGGNLYTMRLDHGTTALTATVLEIQAIPEPSTWLLLGSSMVTLTFLRHRRRKHDSLTH